MTVVVAAVVGVAAVAMAVVVVIIIILIVIVMLMLMLLLPLARATRPAATSAAARRGCGFRGPANDVRLAFFAYRNVITASLADFHSLIRFRVSLLIRSVKWLAQDFGC